ncbi:MAG: DNA polymerase III subunit alpha [Verrucomicrobiae bacterium]|nr:DNA polymerase III subunit alpha [Verrucomicrobiae bacterium]
MKNFSSFVHLHQHTEYSLLDAAVRISDLVGKAKACGAPAVAMTDHGNLFGAIEFYQAAEANGLKPIIGCEMYMAPGSRLDKDAASARDAAYHFVLLAMDEQGYRNLLQLVTEGHLNGFYYKPRIDREILAKHHQGLIATSACLKGEAAMRIVEGQPQKAEEFIGFCKDLFGDRFYLEVQNHGIEEQQLVNRAFGELSRRFGVPLVATNDVHYLEKEHAPAHDALICIGTASLLSDEKRKRYPSQEFYYKNAQEMVAALGEFPEALKNTLAIAERCNLLIDFKTNRYPAAEPPSGKTRGEYFRQLVEEGVKRRYGFDPHIPNPAPEQKAVVDRLHHEFQVIEKQKFISYFLIVWDFIHHAREKGVPVGPGRGSAAGSLIAYALGITNLDPLRYALLFERFLNPERVSPPDIDIDFCYNRREEVIRYVRQKYGASNVAQIATFGTMGAKAVVRDVGRVMGLPYGDVDKLAKMIPNELKMTLDKALGANPELKQAVSSNPVFGELFATARTLEGLARQTSVHAAGVVICGEPLVHFVPLSRDKSEAVVTQYPMDALGKLNLLKMDFLGLKTLTVIQNALNQIEQRQGTQLKPDDFPLDDPKTFDLLNRAETTAVFQLESPGMRDLARRFGITRIEDIFALIALFRPGPMDLIPDFIKRKNGQVPIEYDHPLLEPICKETYGMMIYQEQVMQATTALAGFSLGQADLLRRAMGKKKVEEMAAQRVKFVEGCHKTNKIPASQAQKIFDLLEKFAGYGFNKSHSAAYGFITYQTAYLKANYTVEYMAAALSNELNDRDKAREYIAECHNLGIEVLPPDVNESGALFTVVGDKQIRFGLAAVKNVGEAAVEAVLAERKKNGQFKTLFDFCERVEGRHCNKRILESLIKSGAFDFSRQPRKLLFESLEGALSRGASLQIDRARGQGALFAMEEPAVEAKEVKAESGAAAANEWHQNELLAFEKELLGFYVSGHPLSHYAPTLSLFELKPTTQLREVEDRTDVRLGGIISVLEKKFSKKDNRPWVVMEVEDLEGTMEVLVYPEAYERAKACLEAERAVLVQGRVEKDEENIKVVASEVFPLEEAARRLGQVVYIHLPNTRFEAEHLEQLRDLLLTRPGLMPVYLCIEQADGEQVCIRTAPEFGINPTDSLLQKIGHLVGEKSVVLKVAPIKPSRPLNRGNFKSWKK